jgi:hypothetical protein
VIHEGEGLPLGFESGDDLLRVHARLDELERHQALDWLGLLRYPDRAHAPFADRLQELVLPDHSAGDFAGRVTGRSRHCGSGGEKAAGLGMGVQ